MWASDLLFQGADAAKLANLPNIYLGKALNVDLMTAGGVYDLGLPASIAGKTLWLSTGRAFLTLGSPGVADWTGAPACQVWFNDAGGTFPNVKPFTQSSANIPTSLADLNGNMTLAANQVPPAFPQNLSVPTLAINLFPYGNQPVEATGLYLRVQTAATKATAGTLTADMFFFLIDSPL